MIGNVKPELELGFPDIRSYGVSSIGELVAELAPQADSAGAPPVVLLNGKRIPSFAEIQDIPAEAISRVEILPEEVAVSYGYQANQKVINIVLRERYRTMSAETRGVAATDGEGHSGQLSAGTFRVRDDTRMNINGQYFASDDLAQRLGEPGRAVLGERSPAAESASGSRSPNSASERFALSGSVSRPLLPDVSGTFSASFERDETLGYPDGTPSVSPDDSDDSDPATGPAPTAGETAQQTSIEAKHLGVALNGALRPWQWSFNAAYDADTTRRSTSLVPGSSGGDPPVADRSSRASTSLLTGDLLLSGPLLRLPAGDAISSVRVGASLADMEIGAAFDGVPVEADRSRDIARGQVSLDVPLASRVKGVLAGVGDLAINGNAGVEHLSDGGSLVSFGYGLRWEPVPQIRLTLSRSEQENAPTMQQIGDLAVVISNMPVFDYASGETVFVSLTAGGNAGLAPSKRRATRAGLILRPFDETDFTLLANYSDIRANDPVYTFAVPTPSVEQAFPDRFARDQDGALTNIDARPVNIARSESSRLRWGVHFSVPLKTTQQRQVQSWIDGGARPEDRPAGAQGVFIRRGPDGETPGQAGPERALPTLDPRGDQGEPVTFRAGPGAPTRGGPPGQGRLQFGVFHTWHLVNRLELGPSLPALDLLNGDAIGSTGGQPRHEFEAQLGYFNDGAGLRVSARWQSATRVEEALGDGAALRFSDRATLDLRAFANLGQVPGIGGTHRLLSGVRISAGVDNLLDERVSVRPLSGTAPVAYMPAYLDRSGRTLSLSLRKVF